MKWWDQMPWSSFFECWVLSQLFTLIKRLFSSSSLSAIWVVSSAYLRLLIFLSAILIPPVIYPAWHFTWCTLHMSQINEWQYTALKGLTSLRMIMEIMMIDDNGNHHPKWSQTKKGKYHMILFICRIYIYIYIDTNELILKKQKQTHRLNLCLPEGKR